MGILALIVFVIIEVFFLVWSFTAKQLHRQEKNIVRISEFAILIILLLSGIFDWGFRYIGIVIVLLIQAIIAGIALKRQKEKPFKRFGVISKTFLTVVLYAGALIPAIICPQYTQPLKSGNYTVDTAKYTWVDDSRTETYSSTGENRKLTVEFWYPNNAPQKCPLVVFSHGAFGFSGSNRSTFEDLASNGYVIASIGHTYQAFYTLDTSNTLTTVDMDFLNRAVAMQNNEPSHDEFEVSHSWLALRTADENFVLDTIIQQTKDVDTGTLFQQIDIEEIGLFGHSLGGATSAQVGRQRSDIDAVIILDGTMIGEQMTQKENKTVLNDSPYPVPLLDIYAEDHYTSAQKMLGDDYANFYAGRHAVNATEVVIKGAGHLNFTDLPLFSPALANMLGVGSVDARYCINTTNQLVLEYFNCYLKGMQTPQFEKEYSE